MPKKILIVDDDKDLLASLERVLRTKGYEVVSAASGAEGLKALEAHKPDLIILDVMMETDTAGFEVADRIRSRRANSRYLPFRDVPIIIQIGRASCRERV
jgi:CheY-like chemotaxis protein